jgi:hypothetical protein
MPITERGFMRTQFSPGPWRVLKQHYPERRHFIVFNNYIENEVDLDQEANRALVEAAPDMYAALKTIEAYIEARGELSMIGEIARKALAKADGERDVA